MKIILLLIAVLLIAEVIGLLVLRSQIDRYATFWNQRATGDIPENALIYVALGDSTAQGIGATSPMRGYVGLLARSLEQKYNRPVHIINLSSSGATLKDCIDEQLPRLASLDVEIDVATIEIGANDMNNFEPEQFRNEMQKIMEDLPPDTVISDMPYFGGGRKKNYQPAAIQANEIIYNLADNYDVEVAKLQQETRANDHIINYAPDFFHPSNAGYKNWHNAFWDVLKQP